MTISKESFIDLQDKYEKVKTLMDESGKVDPENPYVSKYAAKQVLIGMKANIENLLRSCQPTTNEHLKLTSMLATVYLYMGTIAIDTEDITAGEKYLSQCEESITIYEGKSDTILISLNLLNQFGIVWSRRDPKKSKVYLDKATVLYNHFKEKNIAPIIIDDHFKINPELNSKFGLQKLEEAFTLTLYYIAQIYGSLKDALKSSVYCHLTLKRQLESGDYDRIEWALNAATLSQFFLERNGFKEARHHLASSSAILSEYEKILQECEEQSDEFKSKLQNFKHRSADVARCWAKYGILLLSVSYERLLNQEEHSDEVSDLSSDLAKLKMDNDEPIFKNEINNLTFSSLDTSLYENQITDNFILTLKDAHKVFLNAQDWLNKAHSYYVLDSLASEYIDIVMDKNQLYKNLSFFDDNEENQCKMYKRSADLIENVLKEVNPTYYMQYCRQMWFELGQIYNEILDIKMEKVKEGKDRPTGSALNKINQLVKKSIANYTSFITSFKVAGSNDSPKNVDKNFERPYVQALFRLGALSNRFITLDKKANLENVKRSYDYYKEACDFCEGNSELRASLSNEISISKEMTRLLPIKILKLEQEVNNVP